MNSSSSTNAQTTEPMKKRKVDAITEQEIHELSKSIQKESETPEDIYLNPSYETEEDDEDYDGEEDDYEEDDEESDSDDVNVNETIKDFRHKMYNDNQKLNRQIQRLKVENERLSKQNRYLKLSHNNERVDKLDAWKKIKIQYDCLVEKNKRIKTYRRIMTFHIGMDLFYILFALEYLGYLPYIIYALQKCCIIFYNGLGMFLLV